MNAQHLVTGGQAATITFGPTFVVIEGFSIKDAKSLRWWLRLDKDFSVSDGGSASVSRPIDVYRSVFDGLEILVPCAGQDVVDFSVDEGGLELRFANNVAVRMHWSDGELSCAQLDVAETGEQGPELIIMMTFPDDLAG